MVLRRVQNVGAKRCTINGAQKGAECGCQRCKQKKSGVNPLVPQTIIIRVQIVGARDVRAEQT